MKRTEITLINLEADEGHYLTDGKECYTGVLLSVNDNEDNYREITAEEAEKRQAEMLPKEENEV